MLEKTISILIPVYNVEQYIDRCLKSVTSQTYNNLEILIVWQPSNDNSFNILKEWQKKDERIRIIEQQQPDLSIARNTLIKEAKSDFITFVDSDDMLSKEFVEVLYEQMNNDDIDVVTSKVFAFKNVKQLESFKFNQNYNTNIYNKISYLISSFSGKFGAGSGVSQAKLYKKKIFECIYFPNNRLSEDNATIYKALWNANLVVTVEHPLYFYQSDRSDSIMHDKEKKIKLLEAALINRLEQYDFFVDKDNILLGITSYNILTERMRLIGGNSVQLVSDELKLRIEKNKLKYIKNVLLNKNSIKIKVLSILCTFFPKTMYKIWEKRKTIKYKNEWRKK